VSGKGTAFVWIAFGACLTVGLAAMAWISVVLLQLDADRHDAQRWAAREGNVRLALWRMDSTLLPLVGQEAARPYQAYQRPLPEANSPSAGQTPTPLVRSYFQFEPDGRLALRIDVRKEKPNKGVAAGDQGDAVASLTEFASRDQLLNVLPNELPDEPAIPDANSQVAVAQQRQSEQAQQVMNLNEYKSRARNTANFANQLPAAKGLASADPIVRVGALAPVWMAGELLLARRVESEQGDIVQGLWLDWPAIRSQLLAEVHDLLPNADLVPVMGLPNDDQSRMLTTIPALLVPAPIAAEAPQRWSVIRISLLVSWICALAAATLGGGLLYGVIALSDRRRAFVSAVTHELRTPLTTFQLYTEMLDDGFVQDEHKRKSYLQTLRAEAGRLTHLVENVLAYAQLERTGNAVHVESMQLGELIGRVGERLQQRAEQAEMQLDVACDIEGSQPVVRVDPAAAERILFNLVDNACKYGSGGDCRLIELGCRRTDSAVEIRVRDHGPGTGKRSGASLFRPFSKSAADAARTQPGIGLGLSLSRRLARDLGGDLRHDETITDGACFVLTLPIEQTESASDPIA